MKIHEYQGRELLAEAGIPVPQGWMIQSVDEAAARDQALFASGASQVVIKAQVHAGGRGKAGFVKLVRSADEATAAARFMLTNPMKYPQTPPGGLEAHPLLIAAGVDIADRPPIPLRASGGGGRVREAGGGPPPSSAP